MTKIKEAQLILGELGLPKAQQNEISGYTLLALCNITEDDQWASSQRISMGVSKGIMPFIKDNYAKEYAPNTRETFRRQVLHQFVQASIADYNPDNPSLPVNSPKAHYSLTQAALEVIQAYGTAQWTIKLENFHSVSGKLHETYRKERQHLMVPVKLPDGSSFLLSPGKHNEVQAAIIEQFASRFAPGGVLLYLGDTENKTLHLQLEYFEAIGVKIDKHSKLPDIVIHDPDKNWLYLIEAVTSHGPISPKRIKELEDLFENCKSGPVYVTAFPDLKEFKMHLENIAWDTEVWIAEIPDHMIHFNGDRFLGPR